jgi:oligoendopeptidase F
MNGHKSHIAQARNLRRYLGDWPQIAPLFDQLEKSAPRRRKSAAELEKWLLDWSELNAALDEEASRRYIAMTCHTDNADAEKAYLHFVENVEPQLKPRQFALEKIYVAHPLRAKPARRNALKFLTAT